MLISPLSGLALEGSKVFFLDFLPRYLTFPDHHLLLVEILSLFESLQLFVFFALS